MAATVVPSTSDEALAVVKATAPKYFQGISDLTIRNSMLLAMMAKYGAIEYNASSHSFVWAVKKEDQQVTTWTNGPLQFADFDGTEQLSIGLGGYRVTDKLSTRDDYVNRGAQAIWSRYAKKGKWMASDINKAICDQLYIDGSLAANSGRYDGFKTCTAEGTVAAGDKVATCDGSYLGHDTDLGTEGTWSSDLAAADRPNSTLAKDWPLGKGKANYDWISPLLINNSSTAWTGSTKWEDNCEDAMRFARMAQLNRGVGQGMGKAPFLYMFAPDLHMGAQNHFSARNRLLNSHPLGQRLGFGDSLNFEGAILYHETYTPAGFGYGLQMDDVELFSVIPGKKLFEVKGPTFNEVEDGYLWVGNVLGNMRLKPKSIVEFNARA